MTQTEALLRKKIEKIKSALVSLENMRPGTLSQQTSKSSGTPYWQISYTHKMKSRTEYVRPDQVPRLKKEVQVYQKFKELIQQWVDTALELSRLLGEKAKIKPNP